MQRSYGLYDLGADLQDARIRRADLSSADLRDGNLSGADLRDADLSGVRMRGAQADSRTLWPEGFDPLGAGVIVDSAS